MPMEISSKVARYTTLAIIGRSVLHFKRWLILLTLALATTALTTTTSVLADQGKTILVLDASGSMWQKISDGYKIKIAQQVVGDLLDTIPADQEIGLVTYGHRRKGDCGDIELLVEPGSGTREEIADAVNALDPKGKTPLSAAVIKAADVLRIEENEATVILVSDGRETCNLDPCAVGTDLEERGINFTAHVIGFDIDDTAERAQLQCLAENTGGKFLTASNATELSEALATVSQPAPVISALTAIAVDEDGTRIREGLSWTLADSNDRATPLDTTKGPHLSTELGSGSYTITLVREADQQETSLDVKVTESASKQFTLVLPVFLPEASINAVESIIIGEQLQVDWEGPNESGDLITIAKPATSSSESIKRRPTSTANPAVITAPTEPGDYEIRYVYGAKNRVLASSRLVVQDSPASLEALATAPLATSVFINWSGPDQNLDYISIGKPGDAKHLNFTRTKSGSPLKLQMPPETGEYELRYVLYEDAKVLASRPISVHEADVSVEAADTAELGSRINVSWKGPDENLDYISITAKGEEKFVNFTRTSRGNPLLLEMPTDAGEYEIHYVSYRTRSVLATRPVSVTDTPVSISAAESATLGQTLQVDWVGPDQNLDYIAVGIPGDPKHINYAYTSHGNPSSIQMPAAAGEYELRYVLYQDKKVLATRSVSVEAVNVTLQAPANAELGQAIQVSWDGPDEKLDYIAIGKVGDPKHINYAYTSHGNPATVQMPGEPGEYELRYVLYQGNTVLASQLISVDEVPVSLDATAEASIGEEIVVSWQGPDAKHDYIDVADPKTGKYINYTYTRRGSPLKLKIPAKPGDYEIRYILGQGKKVLARRNITVSAVEVEIQTAESATIGSSLVVNWIGPDAQHDYIDVAELKSGRYINYSYTRDGSPLMLQMPPDPGNYEIRYIMGQGKTVLATTSISVEDVEVTLVSEESISISGDGNRRKLQVDWTGPDAKNDYIQIIKAGEQRPVDYVYSKTGSPVLLNLPTEAGAYEISYVLGQGKKVLQTRMVNIVVE